MSDNETATATPADAGTTAYEAPPFQIYKPTDQLRRLNILLYGEAGSGKTVLAGSAGFYEETSPVLIIDTEGGTLSIPSTLGDTTDKVVVRRIDDYVKDMDETLNYLRHANHPFKTVILDSGTELQKICMRQIIDESVRQQMGRKSRDTDVPDVRNWQQNHERMGKHIRNFRDLDMHFIMTCLAIRDKDETTGSVKILPHLPGKMAASVAGFFDVVGYMKAARNAEGELERVMHVTPGSNWAAKDRTHTIQADMVNPTIESIYSKFQA